MLLRFLWRDNPAEGLSEYAMLVHDFGRVDSPYCSNWALRQVRLKTDILLENVINRNFYMDDFLKCLSTEEDIKKAVLLINFLGICSFRLPKWHSNSHNVLSSKTVNLDLLTQPIERALGRSWNVEHDTFVFKPIEKDMLVTK